MIHIFFITVLLLLVIVGYPLWDYFYMKKVKANNFNKWRLYSQIIITQWIVVIIIIIFWVMTKRSLGDLFFMDKPLLAIPNESLWAIGLGMGISICIFGIIFFFSKPIRKILFDALEDESIQFLLPSTTSERLLFFFVAITAGVCEEFIFRGLMVYYFNHLPFELSVLVIGVISSLLFGIVHLYQGWKGVLLTTYLGAIFFILFMGLGNLWIPIILHILIDAKFVFLPNKKAA